jgi:hypothetical protein
VPIEEEEEKKRKRKRRSMQIDIARSVFTNFTISHFYIFYYTSLMMTDKVKTYVARVNE